MGGNRRLVDYYISCGFKHIRNRHLGDVPELPTHYSNIELAMFQNDIEGAEPTSRLSALTRLSLICDVMLQS
jgi:hypothetical protein